jgi:hypothetical protein
MNLIKTLTQMLKYHRSIDVERALRWQYSIGYKAGQRDAMKGMPWPSEPHTDPLQQVTPLPGTVILHAPAGEFTKAVRSQPGHNTDSRILKALPVLQATGQLHLDVLRQKMQEREDMRKKEEQK